MGMQLAEYYKQASVEFGIMGRLKLAMLTKISSEKAQSEPDSPESIRLFQQSLAQLKEEAGK